MRMAVCLFYRTIHVKEERRRTKFLVLNKEVKVFIFSFSVIDVLKDVGYLKDIGKLLKSKKSQNKDALRKLEEKIQSKCL